MRKIAGKQCVKILRELKPREAKLFAELNLPTEVYESLHEANIGLGKHGISDDSFEQCIWRVICDSRQMPYVGFVSRRNQRKAVCFSCEVDSRIHILCGTTYSAKPTPGTVWNELRPYARGTPEKIEQRCRKWVERHSPPDVTDCIELSIQDDDELTFIDMIKKSEDRHTALMIFADLLEERGDNRAQRIRQFYV